LPLLIVVLSGARQPEELSCTARPLLILAAENFEKKTRVVSELVTKRKNRGTKPRSGGRRYWRTGKFSSEPAEN
jgi:hypothetical protein